MKPVETDVSDHRILTSSVFYLFTANLSECFCSKHTSFQNYTIFRLYLFIFFLPLQNKVLSEYICVFLSCIFILPLLLVCWTEIILLNLFFFFMTYQKQYIQILSLVRYICIYIYTYIFWKCLKSSIFLSFIQIHEEP